MAERLSIHVEIERIDDKLSAVTATCETVYYGNLYRAGAFILVERSKLPGGNWKERIDWRGAAEQRLRDVVLEQHGGRLPFVCPVREIN